MCFSWCLVGGEETSADSKMTSQGAPWLLHFPVQISWWCEKTWVQFWFHSLMEQCL